MGNGGYQVTSADCQAALNDAKDKGTSWAQSWFSSQTLASGWKWAQASATVSFTGDSCPEEQSQSTAFSFTASTITHVSANAYNAAAATQFAANRLNGQLPSGYQWKSGSQTTCSPVVKSASGATVTLRCGDTGVAVYTWSTDHKSQLAGTLAGRSKSDAVTICNKAIGVKSGSCSIAIQGGDGTVLPKAANVLTVVVNTP
jgi:hypothetical protein